MLNSLQIFDVAANDVADVLYGLFEFVLPDIQLWLIPGNAMTVIQDNAAYGPKQRRDDLPKIDSILLGC
jgi:hypothetical protein